MSASAEILVLIDARTTSRCKQEAQLMLTAGATHLAVSRGQQTWYHFGSVATYRHHASQECRLPIRHFHSSSVL